MIKKDDGKTARELARGYQRVAVAIIERAREDYINSYRMLNIDRGEIRTMNEFYKHKLTLSECERFFASGWIRNYVDYDSDKLIAELKEKALNN